MKIYCKKYYKKQRPYIAFVHSEVNKKKLLFKLFGHLKSSSIIRNNYIIYCFYFFANIKLRNKDFVNHLTLLAKKQILCRLPMFQTKNNYIALSIYFSRYCS